MTWFDDHALALLVLATTAVISAARSPVALLKSLAIATPLSIGLSWFNALVAASRGGDPFLVGVMVAARIYSLASLSSYFVSTTDPYELAHDLSRLVRPSIAYAFYTAYVIALRTLDYSKSLVESYKTRRLIRSSLELPRVLVPFMASLVRNAVRTSEYLGVSMESRWINDNRVYWRSPSVTYRELVELSLMLAAPAAYLLFNYWRGVA